MAEKLNEKFRIEREQLEDRLHHSLARNNTEYDLIIPLRDVVKIEDMALMKVPILEALIRNIPLRNGNQDFPYAESEILVYSIEPKGVKVGQTFVTERKIISIMSAMSNVFSGFVTKGVSKMPPYQIYGTDAEGEKVAAFYIPPIVEHYFHEHALLDGMHRSYICSSAGTTVNAVHIKKAAAKLPFTPIGWEDVHVVTEKPPVNERYVDLVKDLFRDLSYVGIDG